MYTISLESYYRRYWWLTASPLTYTIYTASVCSKSRIRALVFHVIKYTRNLDILLFTEYIQAAYLNLNPSIFRYTQIIIKLIIIILFTYISYSNINNKKKERKKKKKKDEKEKKWCWPSRLYNRAWFKMSRHWSFASKN